MLRLMETLQDNLLGCLGGDTPGIGRGRLNHNGVTYLDILFDTDDVLAREPHHVSIVAPPSAQHLEFYYRQFPSPYWSLAVFEAIASASSYETPADQLADVTSTMETFQRDDPYMPQMVLSAQAFAHASKVLLSPEAQVTFDDAAQMFTDVINRCHIIYGLSKQAAENALNVLDTFITKSEYKLNLKVA